MQITITDHNHVRGTIEGTPNGLAFTGDVEHLQGNVNANTTRYQCRLWRSLTDAELVRSLLSAWAVAATR